MKIRISNVLNNIALFVFLSGLVYLGLAMRTASYGSTALIWWPLMLGMFILFSTVCLLPLLAAGYSLRKSFCLIVGIGISIFAISESVAGVEEYFFRRYCQHHQFTETVFRKRWWPFRHHYLGYNPETKQYFGGD